MTYEITSACIACDRCRTQCPTHAIRFEGRHYWIEPSLCTHCTGKYSVAQCAAVCPTNSCIQSVSATASSSDRMGYWEQWFHNYNRAIAHLTSPTDSRYWENWFTEYSHQVSKLLLGGMGNRR